MRTQKIFLPFLLVIFSYTFAQERLGTENFIPVNAPDITAFNQVNFLPISEYTGKPNITIPLYEIKIGSLKIPIGLTYNYGGVKVDAVASSVGMNWSLQAGGNVSRQVNGLNDLDVQGALNGSGTLGYLATATSNCSQYMSIDGEPDVFLASAPGLNTKFIPKRAPGIPGTVQYNGDCIELTNLGNKISLKQWWYNSFLQLRPTWPNNLTETIGYDLDLVSTRIVNTNGFIYSFSDFSISAIESDRTDWDNSPQQPILPKSYNTNVTSHQLSSIYDPTTDRYVYFDYNLPYTQNAFYNKKGVFRTDGTIGSKNIQLNIFKNKRLSKIRFDEGEVEFFYNFSRLDLPTYENNIALDNKALSRITVKDIHGKIIKDIRLVYSNVQSKEGCTAVECYRLFLKEVYFVGQQGNTLPGYKFTYNPIKLPKRLSYITDFFGFYNGESANPQPTITGHYIPITYHYPNHGKYSFLPFDIGDPNYQQLNGNYSLASNANFAKAGILEKIEYPTGGYMILENESNEFKILGHTVQGGGLRVKKQKLYDSDATLVREISYEYKNSDGSTSGTIVNLPKYNDYIFAKQSPGIRIFQTNMANQKTTESSYIGYSRLKIKETGNGYVVKNFTSPADYPNTDGIVTLPTNPTSIAQQRVSNGCSPNLTVDKDLLRGKLLKEEIFKEGGYLKQKTTHQYAYKSFGTIPISSTITNPDGITDAEGCEAAPFFMSESANLPIERNLIATSQVTRYNNDGSTVSAQSDFTYDTDYPFIKEKSVLDSKNNRQVSKNYYANDITLVKPSSGPLGSPPTPEFLAYLRAKSALDSLKAQNRIAEIIKTETYEKIGTTEDLLSTQQISFGDWGSKLTNSGNIIAPEFKKSAKGAITNSNKLEDDIIFHKYDNKGNLIEASKADGTHVYFIWGYNQNRVIAKIENFTADQAAPLLLLISTAQTASDADDDTTFGFLGKEGTLRNKLQLIRNHSSLSNAEMTSYTYDPLIGITSITDSRGQTTYYHYDEFNRLEYITDVDGKIVGKNEYHLTSQN
jgi:YD repeat-containing protein